MADSRPRRQTSDKRHGGRSDSSGGSARRGSRSRGPDRRKGAGGDNRQRAGRSPKEPRDRGEHDDRQSVGRNESPEKPRFRIERLDDAASERPAKRKKKPRRRPPVDVSDVNFGSVAAATRTKLADRLAQAANAFAAERYSEAERLLVSIDKLAPNVVEVVELLGLSRYRQGKWAKAAVDLRMFHQLSGSVEQHPVLADCARAVEDWPEVERLWKELGSQSPEPALVEEGRIVLAGSLADRGRLADAVRTLERAPKVKGRPSTHHLRRWYALADLYERVGDRARARRLFAQVVEADVDFGDAAERLSAI